MWEEKIVNKVDKRTKSVLIFEDVLKVHSMRIDQRDESKVLELLDFNIYYNESNNIEIELLFSNDATIKLETEVINSRLEDQGESWYIKNEK